MSKTHEIIGNPQTGNSSLGVVMFSGFHCIESPILPINETVAACNIETKEEVRLLTGKKINCIKQGNKLLLSKEMYESLKSHYTQR